MRVKTNIEYKTNIVDYGWRYNSHSFSTTTFENRNLTKAVPIKVQIKKQMI